MYFILFSVCLSHIKNSFQDFRQHLNSLMCCYVFLKNLFFFFFLNKYYIIHVEYNALHYCLNRNTKIKYKVNGQTNICVVLLFYAWCDIIIINEMIKQQKAKEVHTVQYNKIIIIIIIIHNIIWSIKFLNNKGTPSVFLFLNIFCILNLFYSYVCFFFVRE